MPTSDLRDSSEEWWWFSSRESLGNRGLFKFTQSGVFRLSVSSPL